MLETDSEEEDESNCEAKTLRKARHHKAIRRSKLWKYSCHVVVTRRHNAAAEAASSKREFDSEKRDPNMPTLVESSGEEDDESD